MREHGEILITLLILEIISTYSGLRGNLEVTDIYRQIATISCKVLGNCGKNLSNVLPETVSLGSNVLIMS